MKKNGAGRRKTLPGHPFLSPKRKRRVASPLKDGNGAIPPREETVVSATAGLASTADARLLREANERLVLATVQAQTQKENAEEARARMAYLAEHDSLTGLPNRSLLSTRLAQAIGLAQRHGRKVALMYLDLDHFKEINDTFGHAVGDQLLLSAAERLKACVRISDTVCRQGGDEFVVLLAEVESVDDAALAAEKLIETVARPHSINGHRFNVTLSVGISLYPDDGLDVDTVLRNADAAMYHAKRNGRNNYQLFYPGIVTRSVERAAASPSSEHGQHERRAQPPRMAPFPAQTTNQQSRQPASESACTAFVRLEEAISELVATLSDHAATKDRTHTPLPVRQTDASYRRKDFLGRLLADGQAIDEARAVKILAILGRIGDSLLNSGDRETGFGGRNGWRLIWALQHVLAGIPAERREAQLIDAFQRGHALTLLCAVIQVLEICHDKPVDHGPAAVLTQIRASTVEKLKQIAVSRIHQFRDEARLPDLPELPFVLQRWQKWESEAAVTQWVDSLIADRAQLRRLIPGFLTHGLSQSDMLSGSGTGHSLNLRLLAELIDLETIAAIFGGRRQDDGPDAGNADAQSSGSRPQKNQGVPDATPGDVKSIDLMAETRNISLSPMSKPG